MTAHRHPYHHFSAANWWGWVRLTQPLLCRECGQPISSSVGVSWAYVMAATMPLLFEDEIREWSGDHGAGLVGVLGMSLLLVAINFFAAAITYPHVKRWLETPGS